MPVTAENRPWVKSTLLDCVKRKWEKNVLVITLVQVTAVQLNEQRVSNKTLCTHKKTQNKDFYSTHLDRETHAEAFLHLALVQLALVHA